MLLRFRVANVRSLRDEQELSFVEPQNETESLARPVALANRDPYYTDVHEFVEQG